MTGDPETDSAFVAFERTTFLKEKIKLKDYIFYARLRDLKEPVTINCVGAQNFFLLTFNLRINN